MIKSICIFSRGYPTKDNPEYAFIRPVAHGFADAGIDCTVIAPQSITHAFKAKRSLRAEQWMDTTRNGNSVQILQPRTITFSAKAAAWNRVADSAAVKRVKAKYHLKPDVVYGHFWHCAVLGTVCFPDVPTVVASGEDTIWVEKLWDDGAIQKALMQIKGVIAVSSHCLNDCKRQNFIKDGMQTVVLPNGYEPKEFYPIEKNEARRALGFSENMNIVSFVGSFDERKGVKRLIEASRRIGNVRLLLIGSGDASIVKDDTILFAGRLPHEEITKYLSASDVFVLPTRSEGCCNAIVEAMAAGLPIVSSDGDFNDDILDETNSIRIDPMNVDAIEEAMRAILCDRERMRDMAQASIEKSKGFAIANRMRKIIEFVSKMA